MQNKASKKQAVLFTVINYIGIFIGIISTLFIYPENKEILGIFRYVESIAQVLFPIMLLGASQALVNFNSKLNADNKKQLFNYSIVSILIISFLLFILVFVASYFPFLKGMKYIYFALPIAVFLAFIELFKKQATIIQKIALPTFFDNIIPKLALPVLFILLLQQYLTVNQSLVFYILSYGLIFILSASYLFYHFKPKVNINFKPLFEAVSRADYFKFTLFAFAGSLGSVFAFRIDALMIPKLISMEANGAFSIGVTLASALAIPATGIFTLYAPIISGYLKENNLEDLNRKYKEVSKLLFFIGAILYTCIFLGVQNLFSLLPTSNNLMASVPVILILGFNVLINMGTGFNGEIITYSKYYKFNLIAIALLIVLNVSLNLFFIMYLNLGIEAVAFASLLSMVVFNMAKLVFIYKKFNLLPFDQSYLKLVFIFIFTVVLVYFLPNTSSIFINLVYKVGLSLFINLVLIYKFKLVYEYHYWVNKLVLRK